MDAVDRGRLLFKLADLIEKEAAELAALESLNCGKTITDSQGDMQGVVNTLHANTRAGPTKSKGVRFPCAATS